ncbi:MAG: rnr [Actinomycetia bacterium]|nr:rnr [Actinomycetes bacterium]
MPAHRVVAPALDFSALRRELDLPGEFPPEALAEAEAASPELPAEDLTDVPFVTIDPQGARDLDQAVHLSRTDGGGFLVRYAIADVASFAVPGRAVDKESWRRGETLYFPDEKVPLHPPAISEDKASLLPDVVRPAVVWTIAVGPDGEVTSTDVRRARVRSTAQLDYESVQKLLDAGRMPDPVEPLADFGILRARRALRRGAIDLHLPEQEVQGDPAAGWRLAFRAPLPVEQHNAQVSLLTGECAATIMLAGGVGLLRTLPPADPRDVARLRAAAPALGVSWPDGATPGEVVSAVDAADPRGAAFLDLAATLLRGAGYTAFDGSPPEQPGHAAVAATYAHVTAPLRRLSDRYATEVCLALCAGTEVPGWAREAIAELPATMAGADRKAHEVDRAVLDLAEAVVLAGRAGEVFDAAVVDLGEGGATIVLADPAVRAKCAGSGLALGSRIRARLVSADPVARKVRFELAE